MYHNNKLSVLNPGDDRIALTVNQAKADKMLRARQAVKVPGNPRAIRLSLIGELWPCRTRTARGGVLASIGRGQVYTTLNERGAVDGFKSIFSEDRPIFIAALLDCYVA